jgi:hypothetical protein
MPRWLPSTSNYQGLSVPLPLLLLPILIDIVSVLVFCHQLVAQLLTSSQILSCIHHRSLLRVDLFVCEDAEIVASDHE